MFNLKKGDKTIFKIKGGAYNGTKIKLNSDKSKKGDVNQIIVEDGLCQQVPSYKERDTLYICAPSGAGKSTYLAAFAKEYKKKYPNNNLILISPKKDDEILNKLNPIHIRIDESNFIDSDTALSLDELSDSLVMFDDTEAIADKKLLEAVVALRDRLLTLGRSKKISVAITSHLVMNNRITRIPITESQFFIYFPGGGLTYQVNRYLKNYCGLSNKQIENINAIPSRWICLHKNYPMYIIAKDSAYIL